MIEIILYIKIGCQYCENAISYLERKKMYYTKVIIDSIDKKKKILRNLKMQGINLKDGVTVPIIIINGKYIGGYEDLLKLKF